MECRLDFLSLGFWVFKYEFHFIAEWILYFSDNKNFEEYFYCYAWYWFFGVVC